MEINFFSANQSNVKKNESWITAGLKFKSALHIDIYKTKRIGKKYNKREKENSEKGRKKFEGKKKNAWKKG